MNRKWVYIVVAVVVVAALAVGGYFFYKSSNDYVAKIGNETVSKIEYQFFLSSVKADLTSKANVTDWDKGKIGNEKASDVAKNNALESAREFKIQLIKAKENNVTLSAEDEKNFKSSVENMATQYGGRDELDKTLKQQVKISYDDYVKMLKDFQIISKYRNTVKTGINISDDEIKKNYDENIKKFDKVTVKHVLFKTVDDQQKPLSQEKQDAAKKKADDTLKRIKAGEDIGTLAKQLSEDTGSKENGGEYSFMKNGQMVPEFESWAFDHAVGEVGIVKTTYGYHVMKIINRAVSPLSEVKETIKQELSNTKFTEKYQKDLDEWKKDPKYNVTKNQKNLDAFDVKNS